MNGFIRVRRTYIADVVAQGLWAVRNLGVVGFGVFKGFTGFVGV